MPTSITKTDPDSSAGPTARRPKNGAHTTGNGQDSYVMPIVHLTVPERAVNAGFWAVLVGSTALGAVDLPLAALIGAGVLIARHHRSR